MLIRVLTYNIRGARGTDGIRDYFRIGRYLRELQVDIALIQEVSTFPRLEMARVDRYLEELSTDRFPHFVSAPTLTGPLGWFGNAVMSKFPINRHSITDISLKGREPRNILETFINTPAGPLHVVNTHKGLGYFERSKQMAKLNGLLARQSEIPLVVGGDINEWQKYSSGLRRLNQSLSPLPSGRTFPTILPLFRLDRMWCRPHGMVKKVFVVRTAETRIFSDHYPVMAEIEL